MNRPSDRDLREMKTNAGNRSRLNVRPTLDAFIVTQTQLIRAQLDYPRQLLVSLMQPTKGNGVNPWVSTFDGLGSGTGPPIPYPQVVPPEPYLFTAPYMPGPAHALQVRLQWGAGAVRYETRFDYPQTGGVFGVTADQLNLDVIPKAEEGQSLSYATENDIPVVGAFFCEGAPADPTPMAWLEVPRTLVGATDAWYAVKPFSKTVNVCSMSRVIASVTIEFYNTVGDVLWSTSISQTASDTLRVELDVPRQATLMRIANGAPLANQEIVAEWGIGLS